MADQLPMSAETLFWLIVLVAFVAIVFFSTIILLKSNYKRCSSNQVLVIFGKTTQGPGRQDGPRRRRVRRGR